MDVPSKSQSIQLQPGISALWHRFRQQTPAHQFKWILGVLVTFMLLLSIVINFSQDNTDSVPRPLKIEQVTDPDWTIETLKSYLASNNNDVNTNLQVLPDNYINLGQQSSAWLKIDFSEQLNSQDLPQTPLNNYVLMIRKNRIQTPAQLHYQTHDNTWKSLSLQSSPLFHHHLLTNLPKDIAAPAVYLNLHGRYLRASMHLYDQEEFFQQLQTRALSDGLYYGMLVLFIVYNLMLFNQLKERAYLTYAALLSVILLWFASGQGWLAFFFPSSPLANQLTVSLGLLLAVTSAEFAKHYLGIRHLSKPLFKAITILQAVVLLLFIGKITVSHWLSPTFYQVFYGTGLIACTLLIIGCTWASVKGIQHGHTAAGYYLGATLLLFVMAILMALSAGNIISLPFSWPWLQAASALEVIIFSAGLAAIFRRQQQLKEQAETALSQTQAELVTQLEISNSLKDNILNNTIDPKLFPELAKITKHLTDIRYVQAMGSACMVFYKKGNYRRKVELECNLQNLMDSFGSDYFLRIHKSYLINPQHPFAIQRRTSADYDVEVIGELLPIGRKYLPEVKSRL